MQTDCKAGLGAATECIGKSVYAYLWLVQPNNGYIQKLMLCLLLQQDCTQSDLVSAAEQSRQVDCVLLQSVEKVKHL